MGSIKAFLVRLLDKVKKLPLASMLKPLYKAAMRWAVSHAIYEAKVKLREAASSEVPGAIDKAADALQEKLKAAVRSSPLPEALEEKVAGLIQTEGDKIQERIKEAVKAGGPAAVDSALDAAGQA